MELLSTGETRYEDLSDQCPDHTAAPTHAARHGDARSGRPYTAGLCSACSKLRRFPEAISRHRNCRRHPALPTASAETGVGPATINSTVSALLFLFTVTQNRRDLSRTLVITCNPRKLKLTTIRLWPASSLAIFKSRPKLLMRGGRGATRSCMGQPRPVRLRRRAFRASIMMACTCLVNWALNCPMRLPDSK